MSRLITKKRRRGCTSSTSDQRIEVSSDRYLAMSSTVASPTPHHCATTDAQAMPTIPRSSPKAKARLHARWIRLTVTAVIIGKRAFCMPVNQPLNPKRRMPAGTAQMRV